ncbi:hypothetical protein M2454_000775 [Aequitasia blattaphilus]|uniref:TraG P-loop domain-containing protein n=1 Tax=Aequitasia blattaphilus TaxID=2949332 RepID=A0ABT1E827_9FIRM|nr:hypothetical protein [Aequitasia blattaphilus]MCP1101982.1 hypothetical protein [Aequitasia blattaphilus]MCR8614622.1 hypothetical protein [Aequitasia blattaphilus]
MGIFNATSTFLERKKKTTPVYKTPKSIYQALQVSDYEPTGLFKLEPKGGVGLYDCCYIFEDINYSAKNEEQKESTLVKMMRWLNAMNTDFKISIANEYRNMDEYFKKMFIEKNKEEYLALSDGISQWRVEKVGQEANVNKMMYLVVTTRAKDFEEAGFYFKTIDSELNKNFESWGSRLHKMTAFERFASLRSFFRQEENNLAEILPKLKNGDIKNNVLPISLKSYSNFMLMGETYVSVLFGHDYGSSVDADKFVHEFIDVPFPLYLTLDYAPIERQTLKDRLAAAHTNNERAIQEEADAKAKAGAKVISTSYRKEKIKDELEAYRDQVDDNSEKAFYMGLLLVVVADSEEELAQRIQRMQSIGRQNSVRLDIYNFQQLNALNTALPIGGRQVNHMRSFLTSSIVAFHPYYAQDIQEIGGIFYGINRKTKRAILADRKKLKSPHGIVVGHTGAGKSMLLKSTEISQVLLSTDDDILAIDPQNELEGVTPEWGGTFIDFTPKAEIYLNSFEIPEEIFNGSNKKKEKFVANQSDYAKSFCTATMTNILVTQEHLSIIGRCVRQMYEESFEQKRLKKQPTLIILREKLRLEMESAGDTGDKRRIQEIYNSLEEYTDGGYDMFSHPTNIKINNRFTVFGIANVPENMWEVSMITIMNYLQTRIDYNQDLQRATRFIVDETQVVSEKPTSAAMLVKATVTFRKYGGICTFLMQNASKAIENKALKDMFANCGYKCFLDQSGGDARAISEIIEFSEEEFNSLAEEKPGHGVMVWGKKTILFDAYMDPANPIYDLISTNFHEKASRAKKNQESVPNFGTKEIELDPEQIKETETLVIDEVDKEIICQAASLSAISVRDAAAILSKSEDEAVDILSSLVSAKILQSEGEDFNRQYRKCS